MRTYRRLVLLVTLCALLALAAGRLPPFGNRLRYVDQIDTELVHRQQAQRDLGRGLLVDLNTADAQALQRIRGVGPVLAEAILSHRAENGPFSSVDDLVQVKGIGAASLEKMRPHCYVGEGEAED